MNQKIEFKKDCILKTYASEITDISLTHDYKINEDTIEGYFDISGEYKITKSSVGTEAFLYTVPFTIALSSLIDKDTISVTIDDFSYELEKDVLHLKMLLNMNYEEVKEEEEVTSIEDFIEENKLEEEPIKEEPTTTLKSVETTVTESNMDNIFSSIKDSGYSKYKIYIMREEDTIESVALKYNVSVENIKEYNNISEITTNSKIVIPYKENE